MNHSAELGRCRSTPFLRRVVIKNYKSIGACNVELGNLSILVGRNGAGKSNFLDALRFVMEGLQTSLDHAIKSRGGLDGVRRRSTGHPRNFTIKLVMDLVDSHYAVYEFEIASRPQGGFIVKREELDSSIGRYRVEEGHVVAHDSDQMPPASPDRLYLVNAAGLSKYRSVYDSLMNMGFYNLNPDAMKKPQSPDAGELLHRDGGNIASVLARLSKEQHPTYGRICDFLRVIVPGITAVERVAVGPWETLQFSQEVKGSEHPWRFYASSMSDGTLRALGALVAVTQLASMETPANLVGIEEPETALHPAATGALMDALREAACNTQVIITTHSPDLLDRVDLDTDCLLAVQAEQGTTRIGPIDDASKQAIKDHLYTPGELLRLDQLQMEPVRQATLDEFQGVET
jgi:predicted ATPase